MGICGSLRSATLAGLLAVTVAPATAQDSNFDVTPAIAAAESWLATVDAGRYADSWEAAADLFKATIERPRWETTIVRARGQLGPMGFRKLRSAHYRRTLPGAPEGEYVVIEFDSRFENRPLTVETVTPMRDKDGAWRVSGYLIR